MLGIAAMVAAVAFCVLVAYLASALIQIKKTAQESERLLGHLNNELPSLLRDVRRITEHVNALAIEARDGIEHASVFLHAVGEMGQTVQQVHGLVRGRSGNVITKFTGLIAGVKAASAIVKAKLLKRGEETNGAG